MTAINRGMAGLLVLGAAFGVAGCVTPMANYSLLAEPSMQPQAFFDVEVKRVEVVAPEHTVDPATPLDLWSFIIEEIRKKRLYRSVGATAASSSAADVMVIETKIIDFDTGSRFARAMDGLFGAGKAILEAECNFIDGNTDTVFATAIFTAEIKGGLFGGEPDEQEMSRQIARSVAKFLEQGR